MTETNTITALPTNIAALGNALPPAAERLSVTYEPTRKDGLTIRSHDGAVDTATRAAITERICLLDDALQPSWRIASLKASVPMPPRTDVASDLDIEALRRSLSSLAEATQILPADAREDVRMSVTITAPLTGSTQVDASLEADAVTEGDRRNDVDTAVYVLTRMAARAWGIITREILGGWVLASGVTELQLTGQLGRATATRH